MRCVTLPALPVVVFFSERSCAAVPITPRVNLVAVLVSSAAEDQVVLVELAEVVAHPVGWEEHRGAVAQARLVGRVVRRVVPGVLVADQVGRVDQVGQVDLAGREVTLFEFLARRAQRLIQWLHPFPSRDS